MSLPGRHDLTPYVGDAFRRVLSVDTETGVTVADGAGTVTVVSVGVMGPQSPMQRGRWPVVQIDTGGVPITDTVTYIPGTYTITETDGGVVHSGPLNIRGRGNSTWGLPKKPYRLNLGTKTAPD